MNIALDESQPGLQVFLHIGTLETQSSPSRVFTSVRAWALAGCTFDVHAPTMLKKLFGGSRKSTSSKAREGHDPKHDDTHAPPSSDTHGQLEQRGREGPCKESTAARGGTDASSQAEAARRRRPNNMSAQVTVNAYWCRACKANHVRYEHGSQQITSTCPRSKLECLGCASHSPICEMVKATGAKDQRAAGRQDPRSEIVRDKKHW